MFSDFRDSYRIYRACELVKLRLWMVMLVGFCSIIFRPTFFSITSILPSSFCYSPNIGLHSTIAMPYIQHYGTKEQKVSKHSFDFWMYELYSLVYTSSSSCLLWTRPKWKCTQVTKGPSFKRKSKSKTRHRTAISRRWLLGSALQAWQSLSRMQAATCRSLLCSLLQSFAVLCGSVLSDICSWLNCDQ